MKQYSGRIYIGVDGGATSTAATAIGIVAEQPVVMGQGSGASANYRNVGIENCVTSITNAIRAALTQAQEQYTFDEMNLAIVAAVAGIDTLAKECHRSGG